MADYKKIYKKNLIKYKNDKAIAHYYSWSEFQKQILAMQPGWWTLKIRNDILNTIYEIEASVEEKNV